MRIPPGFRSGLAALAVTVTAAGAARADIGHRAFAGTILTEDPEPDDQLTLPEFAVQGFNGEAGSPPTREYTFGFGVEKRITTRLGLSLSDAYSVITAPGEKNRTGFQSLVLGAKYEVYLNPTHEFILSVGVLRAFGRTGAAQVDAEQTGVTTPSIWLAKGFGDLPIGALRPLAVTGSFGYAVADTALKATGESVPGLSAVTFNTGLENRWVGGMSVQYSLSYLNEQVRHLNLPEWLLGVTPILEIVWSSPANAPSREGTQLLFAPGLVWENDTYKFGVEMLIPGNHASGRGIGVIAQLQVALGRFAPALGRPVFGGEKAGEEKD